MTYAWRASDAAPWMEITGNTLLPRREPGATAGPSGWLISAAFIASFDDAWRAAHGFVAVVETSAADGQTVLGSTVEDVSGVPTRAWLTEAIPDADLATSRVAAVNAYRDARIDGGFMHNAASYQTRPTDRENIAILGVQAQLAIAGGAQPGDLRWHGGATDFVWITADNATVALDAPNMAALFLAGIAFKTALTFAARAKKDWLLDPARTRSEILAFDPEADWPV